MKICECCGKRPVGAGKNKYCKECAKHLHAICVAKKRKRDITKLWFTENKLCECCGKRSVGKRRTKYCNICGKHIPAITDAKKRGADISQLWFTGNKLCEYCGKRPIAPGKIKYCIVCSRHMDAIYTAQRRGNFNHLKFERDRICQKCGTNPVGAGRLKYCDQCAQLSQPRPLCECCHQHPVGYRKRKYCDECGKHAPVIRQAKYRGADPSQLHFTGIKMCECCGKNPIGNQRRKYCDECGKHAQQIHSARKKNQDLSKLDFNQIKLCECCGKHLVTGIKYCYKCRIIQKTQHNKQRIQNRKYQDLEKLDHGEELSLCTKCGINPRAIGYNWCLECNRKSNRERYRRKQMIKRNLTVWQPVSKNKPLVCSICHQEPPTARRSICKTCLKIDNNIYHITSKHIKDFKPVPNPEAYYSKQSSNLTCPICRAEYCLPYLPVGRKCQDKIVHHRIYQCWKHILALQGIRVPNVNDILPEGCIKRGTCWKCLVNPVMPGIVFCNECLKNIMIEKSPEMPFKAILGQVGK